MKLGEIKIEALKLMFANGDDALVVNKSGSGYVSAVSILEAMTDNQYREFLLKMPGAINRCFGELETYHVIPVKRKVIVNRAEENEYNKEIDLAEVSGLTDFDEIERITVRNGTAYNGHAQFMREGNTIILPLVRKGDTVALMYYPHMERITDTTDNTAELQLPDKIACLIPYYIKFDLFREDNASEANTALQAFTSGIAAVKTSVTDGYQDTVENVTRYWGE